jgi:hypothetical protein
MRVGASSTAKPELYSVRPPLSHLPVFVWGKLPSSKTFPSRLETLPSPSSLKRRLRICCSRTSDCSYVLKVKVQLHHLRQVQEEIRVRESQLHRDGFLLRWKGFRNLWFGPGKGRRHGSIRESVASWDSWSRSIRLIIICNSARQQRLSPFRDQSRLFPAASPPSS